MPAQLTGLSTNGIGYLNYLSSVLLQPQGAWDGFYMAQSPSMNFARRYQLAFATYALAAMSQKTPAYRAPYAEAMRGAIERMLDAATWGYWRTPERADEATSGHVAVLISPHQLAPSGPPSDPIAKNNLQYSGHLSTMLGLYEKASGDKTYDAPFTLHDPASDVSYTYTHSEVAGRIYSQMRESGFGGVCCEPGMAYVPCNNYSLASNTLHDLLHGTSFSEANGRWLETVRRKMALKGPAVRGVFGTSYMQNLHLATPVAFNFTDVWGLAFLMPFDRELVRKLYGKFKKKAVRADGDGAYVDSSGMSERLEISDRAINTGFGLILARGIGDAKLADSLLRYSVSAFGADWSGTKYMLGGAPRTLHATALYALAECLEPGGESFTRLFHAPASDATQPELAHVEDASGRVGVFQAEYDNGEKTLHIGIRQVGEPAGGKHPVPATLTLNHIATPAHIELNGVPLDPNSYSQSAGDSLQLLVSVAPEGDTTCVLRAGSNE